MSRIDTCDQMGKVRSAIGKRIDEIVELIPASPENTRDLTLEVVLAVVQRMRDTLDLAEPVIDRFEDRLRNMMNTLKQIEGGMGG